LEKKSNAEYNVGDWGAVRIRFPAGMKKKRLEARATRRNKE